MIKEKKIETLLIHAAELPDPITGAVAPPLIRTKTFKQEFGKKAEFQYARGNTPTRKVLEEKLAAIEGYNSFCTVFSSGLAAETMFFLTLNPSDHIIIPEEVYGGTHRLLTQVLNKFNITFSTSNFESEEEILSKITPNTKYFFIESLTNPSLKIINLNLIKKISQKTSIQYVIDATFTPPCALRGFDYGAEVIIHSASKYLAGHNDLLAGAIITTNKTLHEKLQFLQRAVGAILPPDECYKVIQGIKTLSIRWKEASKNAQLIAEFLEKNDQIKRVIYPGLKSYKKHDLAKSQIKNGFGSVVSFELKEEDPEIIKLFIDTVQENDNIIFGESLASPETLLAYPYTMSHMALSDGEKQKLKISKSFFRLSLGLESPIDIIEDLERGLLAISLVATKKVAPFLSSS